MLNVHLNRRPITRAGRAAIAAALVVVALPLAAVAQTTFAKFSGSLSDSSDASLPGAKVILMNTETKAKYEVTSNRDGSFEFAGLPAGAYSMETELPGFASLHSTLTIAGQDVQRNFRLDVASLEESYTVVEGGSASPPQVRARRPLPACASAPPAIPGVGGQIRAPMRVRTANAVYPSNVPGAKAEEIVVLKAHIKSDGTMGEIEAVGSPNPAFRDAAIDAVRQWEFDETLLNCVPIEVSMTVTVRFKAAN
jgi:hypothetical protein